MREQTEHILHYRKISTCMADLAVICGLGSTDRAAKTHARLAPLVVESMAAAGRSSAVADELVAAAANLHWSERAKPERLFGGSNPEATRALPSLIFGDTMPLLVSTVAVQEDVTEANAFALLEAICGVTLAVMVGRPEEHLSTPALMVTLASNGSRVVHPHLAGMTAASQMSHDVSDEPAKSSNWGQLAGVGVSLLAVASAGLIAFGGGWSENATPAPEVVAFDASESDDSALDAGANAALIGAETEEVAGPVVVQPADEAVARDAILKPASIVLSDGTLFLEGDVSDQATADELVASLGGIDSSTPVVNRLNVAAGAPAPSGKVVIAETVFFDMASDQVSAVDTRTLDAIAALAEARSDWILTITGHADSQGTEEANLDLSLRRATAVQDLLIAQGVPEQNMQVRGAGETASVADNTTDEGRAANRRIEFEFSLRP